MSFLNETIAAYLAQDCPSPTELVILNSNPRQKLVIEYPNLAYPNIRIVNLYQRPHGTTDPWVEIGGIIFDITVPPGGNAVSAWQTLPFQAGLDIMASGVYWNGQRISSPGLAYCRSPYRLCCGAPEASFRQIPDVAVGFDELDERLHRIFRAPDVVLAAFSVGSDLAL